MEYKELKEIKTEFKLIGLLEKKAKFKCFADNIFSYYLKDGECMHEISIINERATFKSKEKIIDLLELKQTFYLCHSVYLHNERISRKKFRLVDQEDYIQENLN